MNALLVVLLASAASGVATVALLPQITAIPGERWALRSQVPVFSMPALSALAPGMVALAFRAPPEWALVASAAGGVIAIVRMTLRYAPIRTVKRLSRQLVDDTQRPSAMAAIGSALDRARPRPGDVLALRSWAQAGLIGAAHLIDADEPSAARGVLDRLSKLTFRGPTHANHALLRVHVELCANDLVAARAALASVTRPTGLALLDAHADVLEALTLACEGNDRAALARLDGWKHAEGWYLKLQLTARLVAHASRGDTEREARIEAEIGRRFGHRALAAARALSARLAPEPALRQPT